MSLWKNTDANTSVPRFAPAYVSLAPTQNNSNTLFGNTQISAIITNQAVGVFGVDATEKSNTSGEGRRMTHAGWVLREAGTGGITGISATGTSSGWGSSGYLNIIGGGVGNTRANIYYTNTAGVFAFSLNAVGSYVTTPSISGNTQGSGTGLTFTITMGGRANRVTYETLVAMGSMTGDANDDAILPE